MLEPRYWLVVPAAGTGQRMQADCPKQYLRINDRFIIDIVLSRLLGSTDFTGCMVALHPQDSWWHGSKSRCDKRIRTCVGGDERSDSVLSALQALSEQARDDDWVLVHDVARPCVAQTDLRNLMTSLARHPVGGLLATPVTDTLKRSKANLQVSETVDRQGLWRALTPQMFRYGALRQALQAALSAGVGVTDEASAMELAGATPVLVEGRPDNIKITLPADVTLAGFILSQLSDNANQSPHE